MSLRSTKLARKQNWSHRWKKRRAFVACTTIGWCGCWMGWCSYHGNKINNWLPNFFSFLFFPCYVIVLQIQLYLKQVNSVRNSWSLVMKSIRNCSAHWAMKWAFNMSFEAFEVHLGNMEIVSKWDGYWVRTSCTYLGIHITIYNPYIKCRKWDYLIGIYQFLLQSLWKYDTSDAKWELFIYYVMMHICWS